MPAPLGLACRACARTLARTHARQRRRPQSQAPAGRCNARAHRSHSRKGPVDRARPRRAPDMRAGPTYARADMRAAWSRILHGDGDTRDRVSVDGMSTRNPPRAPGHEPESEPERGSDHDECHEEDRDAILARRALFIASALAGISLAVGCEGRGYPKPCLSMAVVEDAGPPPMPCLLPMMAPDPPPDAGVEGADGGLEGGASTSPDASAPDASVAPRKPPPPVPRPCLTIAVPNPPPPPPSGKK